MRKNEKKQSLVSQAIQVAPVVIAVLGIIGTILNVYLTSRLVPITDSINSVSQRADAFYASHQDDVSQTQFAIIQSEIKSLQVQIEDVHKYFFGN